MDVDDYKGEYTDEESSLSSTMSFSSDSYNNHPNEDVTAINNSDEEEETQNNTEKQEACQASSIWMEIAAVICEYLFDNFSV